MAVTARDDFLSAADVAVSLLGDPAVAARWGEPSALAKLSVGGLAAHLARQVTRVVDVLDAPVPAGPAIPVIDHYRQATWVGADLDSEANVGIRDRSEQEAEAGASAVLTGTTEALAELRRRLPAEPADRLVGVPWMGWALTLDDFLLTRMLEITVHGDDLAVSVGVATPPLPASVTEPVLDLLCRLAVHRHGVIAVLRALSRAERAPATIAAL
ncbi:MAG: maleylpyruvate isomerase N-terminal domain-containing protein [Micromonosporaceae bacterium]|nr:maleylpyruvate isomerase N-terminal domain-containing protein [Micromonosporaceae bacterium]